MANNYFRFKQFTIQQGQCAMKVCTDACLFGAILPHNLQGKNQVLDIGTGTGLLSLMLAQQNHEAIIDAVEIDRQAALQAKENAASSPWANRIHVFHEDILDFNPGKKYGCIISNPPFFEDDLQSPDIAVNHARHNTSLNLSLLLQVVDKQLAAGGEFAVLLPYARVGYFIEEASRSGLYLNKQIAVKQTPKHPCFRGILFFSRTWCEPGYSEITIKDRENNYSPGFTSLLKDYYLFL